MNLRKRVIVCSTVFVLGLTGIGAPQALAAPPQLEGKAHAPAQGCAVEGAPYSNQDYFEVTSNQIRFLSSNESRFDVAVRFKGDAERILTKTDIAFTLRNNGSNGARYTMTKDDSVGGTAPFDERNGEIAPGREISITYEDTGVYEPDPGQHQEWRFSVTIPADPVTNEASNVKLETRVDGIVAPWPNEDEECRQYIPQRNVGDNYWGLMADGSPARSVLSLWDWQANEANRYREISESEAQRIQGTVYSRLGPDGLEDPIPGAEIKLKTTSNRSQDHTISVPYGFVPPGTPDDEKPDGVYFQYVAQPRPETQNSKYAIYREPFILKRREDATGRSLASHADFVGFVPLTKFDTRFIPTKGRPGEVVEVNTPRTEDGDYKIYGRRWFYEDTTVKVSPGSQNSPAKDWNPRIVDGSLRFSIPEDARTGTVKFNVDFTYSDGSMDKNVPIELIVEAPVVYDEVTAKRGEAVTVSPSKTSTLEGVRYYLAEGQDLEGWNVHLTEDGSVELTVAENAKDGERKSIEVNLIYPDGRIGTAHAVVNVRDKSSWWWLLTLPIVGGVGTYILDMLNRVPVLPYPEPARIEPPQQQRVEPAEQEKPGAPLPVDAPRKPIIAVPSGATVLDSHAPVVVVPRDRG